MGDDDKPFACPSCGQRFANEDHLSVHKHKHEMTLKFGPPKLDGLVVDQTPTPTRFLKNCEEVGLFQELSGASPFEQDFKKASEQSTSQDSGDQAEPAETAPLPAPETRVPAPAAPVAHVAPVSMETSAAPTQPEPTRVSQPPQIAATNVVTSPSVTMATQELVPTIGIAGTVSTVITQAPAGMARQMNTFQGSLPVLLHLPNGTTMPVAVPVPASIANPSVQVPSAIPAPQSSPTGSTIQQQHPVQPPQSEAKLRLKAALAGSSMPNNMSVMSQAVDVIMSQQQQQQQQHAREQEQEQDTSFTIDAAALNRLCNAYPAAKRDIISTTLELLMNDERETAETLEQMGYRKKGTTPKTSPTKTTPKKPSPKKTTAAPKPAPQPPQLSEAQKNRVRSEIKALYPNMPHTVVQMALESADYDKQKVVQLLKFMQEDQQPSSSSSRSSHVTEPTAGPARTTSSARTTSPARFDSSSGSRPVEFSSSHRAPVFGDDSASRRSQPVRFPESDSHRGPAASNRAEQSRIKTMVGGSSSSSVQSRIKASSKPTTRATTTARTTHRSAGYSSPLRNKPIGPDHSLLSGPNRELLMTEYVEQCGPNPEYVRGPALREGAKPHLAKGPNPELIQGPGHFN